MKKMVASAVLVSFFALAGIWGSAEWANIKKDMGTQEVKAGSNKVNAAAKETGNSTEAVNPLDLKNKDAIQERMLNSFQFIDSVKGSFRYASKDVGFNYTVDYQLKWKDKKVQYHVKTVENRKKASEELAYANGELINVYPGSKNFEKFKWDIKDKGEYKKASEVVIKNADGSKEYHYPSTQLNLGMAENSLHSKEIAAGFLEDKSAWNVKETLEFLGRKVVVIEGTFKSYYQEKLKADTFTLWMDQNTGILLKYETVRNGEAVDSLETTSFKIGDDFDVDPFVIPTDYKPLKPAH